MTIENKKYIGYLLVVIVLGVGAYFINKKNTVPQEAVDNVVATTSPIVAGENQAKPALSTKPKSSTGQQVVAEDGIYTVSYENTGFNPKSLEIARGKSVRFVNNSTKALRVADTTGTSAFQAFSQPKTVGKGGAYDYTFNDVGIYEYANQNNTADRGTIIVK